MLTNPSGYSGVVIYTRNTKCCPIRAEEGITGILSSPQSHVSYRDLPEEQRIGGYPELGQLPYSIDELTLDSEGRCVILEFPAFVLFGVYSPAQRDETRTEFRQAFLDVLDARIRNLIAIGKQVVLTGDLNIIRGEMDTAGLKERLRKEDMTVEDFFSMPARRLFNHLIFGGTIYGDRDKGRERPVLHDICREFHADRPGMYTCWETKKNARPGNFGSRIDYVLCSAGIRSWFVDSNIQEGLLGSDHCPVYATLGDTVRLRGGAQVSVMDVMNPGDMFRAGERVRDWTTKDLLPLSAKLIPEFDRRRNIRDMFTKRPSISSPKTTVVGVRPLEESALPIEVQEIAVPNDGRSLAVPDTTDQAATVIRSPNTEPKSRKRQGDASPAANKAAKRNKPSLTRESSTKASNGGGQSSLITGFFKPKTPKLEFKLDEEAPAANIALPTPAAISPDTKSTQPLDVGMELKEAAALIDEQHPTVASMIAKADEEAAEEKFVDPIEAKESWSRLLTKRRPPRCEGHNEPCISLLTKKAGVNCGTCLFSNASFRLGRAFDTDCCAGRSFYMCPRPLGPSGEKEQGTPFRCKTFIWSSDWNG
jgi:AP endonuclease 2